jgi:hypothetical protein
MFGGKFQMSKPTIVPQKIVEKKFFVLTSRLDYFSVRSQSEAVKKLLARNILRKNMSKAISFVACTKYYEPYIVLGGKYSVDYCKKHAFAFKFSDQPQRILFGVTAFKRALLSHQRLAKTIRIMGEEYAHYEKETYIILDKMMKEVPPENFPLAPFESELKNLTESDLDLRKIKTSLESELAFLSSKLINRPSNISRIIKENFVINQRLIVYRPFYELVFQNSKNGESTTIIVDGITGQVFLEKLYNVFSANLTRNFSRICILKPSSELKQYENEAKSSQPVSIPVTSNKIMQDTKQNPLSEESAHYIELRLLLGTFSLVVGLLAANFSLFGWGNTQGYYYILGEYARYACAYGGFGAIVFGSMLLNDFLVQRSYRLKNRVKPIAIAKNQSEKERIHFLVSEFEEEGDLGSQTSKRQKC